MKEINITDLSCQVLEAIKERSLKAKSIGEFERYGLRPIIRYFSENGWTAYSEERILEYVLKARAKLECGDLQQYRWCHARRAAVFMREMAETGTIPNTPLPRWSVEHNVLVQKPKEGTENSDELTSMIQHIRLKLMESDLSEKAVKNYTDEGFKNILRFFSSYGSTTYSQELLDLFLKQTTDKYKNEEMCISCFQNRRKAAFWLKEYHQSGTITHNRLPDSNRVPANALFEALLDEFTEVSKHKSALRESSISVYVGAIRSFFKKLESIGIMEYGELDLKSVHEGLRLLIKDRPRSVQEVLNALRCFARFISESHPELPDITPGLNGTPAIHKKVLIGFSQQEVRAILDSIDTTTAKGKRDYAMIQLAHTTGLRGVDIIHLKLGDMDRRERVLRIVQSKTDVPLTIPFDEETCDAIDEYIRNGRPKSDDNHIFLRAVWPYKKLSATPWQIIARYAIPLIDRQPNRQYGFHALRRGLGQQMLEAQIPVSVIRDVFGHTTRHSLLQYTSASINGLRLCAGSLELIPVQQEELL